jgi:hypothetical protein
MNVFVCRTCPKEPRSTADRMQATMCPTADRMQATMCPTADRMQATMCPTADRMQATMCPSYIVRWEHRSKCLSARARRRERERREMGWISPYLSLSARSLCSSHVPVYLCGLLVCQCACYMRVVCIYICVLHACYMCIYMRVSICVSIYACHPTHRAATHTNTKNNCCK